jgi:hypothetical protein
LTGRADLELTPAALLLARGLIDPYQFDHLGPVSHWLRKAAANLGLKPVAVGSLWQVLANGMISAAPTVPTSIGDDADAALARVARIARALDGSRSLIVEIAEGRWPALVERVLEGRITAADERALGRLRRGLDVLGGRRKASPHREAAE